MNYKIKDLLDNRNIVSHLFLDNAEFVCDHPYDEDCEIDREDYLDLFYMLKHIKEIIEE